MIKNIFKGFSQSNDDPHAKPEKEDFFIENSNDENPHNEDLSPIPSDKAMQVPIEFKPFETENDLEEANPDMRFNKAPYEEKHETDSATEPKMNEDGNVFQDHDDRKLLEGISALQTQITSINNALENVTQNTQKLVQNISSANDVAVMRRENEAFRSDSNMKLMRAYGIDAMIKTYQAICDMIFKLNHPDENKAMADIAAEKRAFEFVMKRMGSQFRRLGIKLQSSETGDEVNEEYMAVYGSEGSDVNENLTMVETENESLKNTVKESVCPAFIWTIPSLVGDYKEWVMEPERVCIYV